MCVMIIWKIIRSDILDRLVQSRSEVKSVSQKKKHKPVTISIQSEYVIGTWFV